jgi:hypothetical protein
MARILLTPWNQLTILPGIPSSQKPRPLVLDAQVKALKETLETERARSAELKAERDRWAAALEKHATLYRPDQRERGCTRQRRGSPRRGEAPTSTRLASYLLVRQECFRRGCFVSLIASRHVVPAVFMARPIHLQLKDDHRLG